MSILINPLWSQTEVILPSEYVGASPTLSTVLVDGISPWLLIIGVIVLFVILVFWLIRRDRHKKPVAPPVDEGIHLPSSPVIVKNLKVIPKSSLDLPEWLIKLSEDQKLMISEPEKRSDLVDTLLIGVGPVGREILSQVAQFCNSRFSENWPTDIQLLQIDIHPENVFQKLEPPQGLDPSQYVVLRPNFREVERNLHERPKEWDHWSWYKNAAPMYGRARSRMALFFDLKDGGENSKLWTCISRSHQGLKNPTVRLIGSTFDDSSSGMLVDLIRICQLACNRPNMDIQLWLMGPQNRDWSGYLVEPHRRMTPSEQNSRTLATLRELERFQRNETNSFYYVPNDSKFDYLRKDYPGAVIQTLIIFQPLKQIHPDDPRYRIDQLPEVDTIWLVWQTA